MGGVQYMASEKEILLPDIGDFNDVEVIEVLVREGDAVQREDSLITLESDKASMEIPSPETGRVKAIKVDIGDRISQGDSILTLQLDEDERAAQPPQEEPGPSSAAGVTRAAEAPPAPHHEAPERPRPAPVERPSPTRHMDQERFKKAHASPAVRRFARELGADLGEITGTGPKGRILKGDVQAYVKRILTGAGGGFMVPELPEVDFARFGAVAVQALSRINRLTGQNLHRNWVRIPHVTQFDEADITELEAFRRSLNEEYRDRGIKVTVLTFLMKAAVSALKAFPHFNASLDPGGEQLIIKHYYHMGVAVDTSRGLVVPVLRDVDRKSVVELAEELRELSARAREGRLSSADMEGGCFSISSLGGVGGTAFTPIINAPEVAILGVSRAATRPVYMEGEFAPRLILPLSLSYDHRVIDGVAGARFTRFLAALLSDTRRMLL
jgi:pyruvate dehydrogenase E2 component (dihydrolipoamide acetyltransferase)